ncbi:MAG: ABC transporter [Desulfuromonas sp.]|uniref:ABC transporter ATP-binding protein n=1 Tax=Desulfuromonas sp. TaxID=892 RepID=UPI000CA8DCBB|nr:ABC transporter ATP-binding protein [Desulfuromonas sp.]PLX83975.1 MAG: ABC transporter [Desulfuromonas sp.]
MRNAGAALAIEDVRKARSGSDGQPVSILQGVSLSARPGELTAVVGPSGGGKSTLIRLVNRLEDPDGGRIMLGGEDILRLDPLQLRRRVGLMAQKPFMYPESVLANLQRSFLYQGQTPPPAEDLRINRVLDLCGLEPPFLGREARTLSLGQQQRVSLARLLVARPQVLLLDEPTSALDRPTADRLADTLREVCRGENLTVLLVTHDLRLAGRIADRLAYLEGGRILEEGPAEQLLNRPATQELGTFLAQPERLEEVSRP